MLILAMRTDKLEAELYVYDGSRGMGKPSKLLAGHKWQAHRELSNTLHAEIENILKGVKKAIPDIKRIAIYQGPGSFTGLRIGMSVANAIGYSLDIPVVACEGEEWLKECLASNITEFEPVHPVYGQEPNITKPRK